MPPVSVDEPLPQLAADRQPVRYMDCTESNDEEEEDGEEEEEEEEARTSMAERTLSSEKETVEVEVCLTANPPKWEDFFTTETLTDSQNSLNSQSQSCCSVTSPAPSRNTGSQTPELFSEEEEENTDCNFSLTLSASLSNHSSQNQDSDIPDTLILQPQREERGQGDVGSASTSLHAIQSAAEELSESQASSDFDIPCTPESKAPQPDELSQLYRKLASGEEVVIRKGSQGSV